MTGRPRLRLPLRPVGPVRLRFATLAAGLVLLVASLAGLIGYLTFRSSVLDRASHTARAEATRLVTLVEGGGSGDGQLVDITDASLTRQLSASGLVVQVNRPSGGLIQGTPTLRLNSALRTRCLTTGLAQARLASPALAVACARVGPASAPVATISVAAPLKDSLASLATLRTTLLMGIVGGAAVAGLLALLLARRALRPLKRIAITAETIRAGDLSERIGYSGHDEVGQLAGVLDTCFSELERSIESRRRFAADASHELKTPLAAIRANVEMLRNWASADPSARQASLQSLDDASHRASRLVADLLALERLDREPQRERVRVRLDEVVLGAVREASPLRGEVRVRVAQLDDVTLAAGDPLGLHQVVLNLITNALEVSPQGSEVVVTLAVGAEDVRVTVADQGPGIGAEDLERIFERFYTTLPGGAGLGLAIAREIAREHGGELSADHNPGAGATFVLRLPLRPRVLVEA